MTGIPIPFGKADCKQQAGTGNYPGNSDRVSLSRNKELPAEGRRKSEWKQNPTAKSLSLSCDLGLNLYTQLYPEPSSYLQLSLWSLT